MVEDLFRGIAIPLLRFGAYSAHAFLLGLVPILLFVLRPAFASLDVTSWEQGRRRVARRLEGLVRAALMGSALTTLLVLVLQAALIAELGTGEVSPDDLGSALETTFGHWVALRFPLLAALAVLLVGRVRPWVLGGISDDRRPSPVWWAAWALLAAGLLVTSTFSGHATVATPKGLSVVNDFVHMAMGSVWFAGIVILAVVLPDGWRDREAVDRLRLLTPCVVRFSHVAVISIGIVAATGVYNSFLHVGSWSDLWETTYGQALFFKIGLFVFVLALGGANHFVVRERLRTAVERGDQTRAQATFRRTIALELALALAIMATTGLLTNLSRTRSSSMGPGHISSSPSHDVSSGSEDAGSF